MPFERFFVANVPICANDGKMTREYDRFKHRSRQILQRFCIMIFCIKNGICPDRFPAFCNQWTSKTCRWTMPCFTHSKVLPSVPAPVQSLLGADVTSELVRMRQAVEVGFKWIQRDQANALTSLTCFITCFILFHFSQC